MSLNLNLFYQQILTEHSYLHQFTLLSRAGTSPHKIHVMISLQTHDELIIYVAYLLTVYSVLYFQPLPMPESSLTCYAFLFIYLL